MVGVSYHELTQGQSSRHSAGQRKQFLLICVVGFAVCANSFINAGLMEPVKIENDGIYPGGDFVYKLIENKDYATTGGLWARISKDLQSPNNNATLDLNENAQVEESYDESLYSIYIDNEVAMGLGRFLIGILILDENKDDELKNRLLAKNDDIENIKVEDNAESSFLRLKYEVGDAPSVRSAVATFPFTNGFVSALLHNYKVFPALYKYAKENHDPNSKIIISTNCNRELKVCRHYIPMIKSDEFLMGHPDTDEYMKSKPVVKNFDFENSIKGLKRMFGF